jgi:hypothetical protein
VAVHAPFTRREHVIGFTVDEHDAVFAREFLAPAAGAERKNGLSCDHHVSITAMAEIKDPP